MDKAHLRQLPNRENHHCFGCSPLNPSGLRMEFYTDEEKVFSWVTVPGHLCGWHNLAHGGVLSTILDEIMGWCAIHLLRKFTLTKSMEVSFLKPVHVQEPLRAEARIVRVRNAKEAVAEAMITNAAGQICTKSQGVFALFTPQAIRRMGLFDEQAIRNVELIIGRERDPASA